MGDVSEAAAQGRGDADEDNRGSGWVVVDVVLKGLACNGPVLRGFHGDHRADGVAWGEDVDFADPVSGVDRAEEDIGA